MRLLVRLTRSAKYKGCAEFSGAPLNIGAVIDMPFILAIDYDGTIISNKGFPRLDVIEKIKEFKKLDSEIILWTCREGKLLEDAVAECKELGLEFDAVNENAPSQKEYMEQMKAKGMLLAIRKIFANFYLDDRAFNIGLFLSLDVEKTCKDFSNY